jgi:hypothetical protein
MWFTDDHMSVTKSHTSYEFGFFLNLYTVSPTKLLWLVTQVRLNIHIMSYKIAFYGVPILRSSGIASCSGMQYVSYSIEIILWLFITLEWVITIINCPVKINLIVSDN